MGCIPRFYGFFKVQCIKFYDTIGVAAAVGYHGFVVHGVGLVVLQNLQDAVAGLFPIPRFAARYRQGYQGGEGEFDQGFHVIG